MDHPDDELAALREEVARLRAKLDRRHRRRSAKAERNAEIVRLRAEDRRHWTYRRLAHHFGTTVEAVRKVVARAREPDTKLMSARRGAECRRS
jgi:hypothetical protein